MVILPDGPSGAPHDLASRGAFNSIGDFGSWADKLVGLGEGTGYRGAGEGGGLMNL